MTTTGEYKVASVTTPSADDTVKKIKRMAADLIDEIEAIPNATQEAVRLRALAMTAVEEGTMWAVKAATKKER